MKLKTTLAAALLPRRNSRRFMTTSLNGFDAGLGLAGRLRSSDIETAWPQCDKSLWPVVAFCYRGAHLQTGSPDS